MAKSETTLRIGRALAFGLEQIRLEEETNIAPSISSNLMGAGKRVFSQDTGVDEVDFFTALLALRGLQQRFRVLVLSYSGEAPAAG